MNITILDGYGLNPGDLSWECLDPLGTLTIYDRTAPADVVERSRGAEAILTNKTVLNAETLRQLPDLKYIGVLATGYNVVDIEEAKRLGIVVTNIPSYSTMSVAQMVFSLLLAAVGRVEHYAEENHRGRWTRSLDFCYWDTKLTELCGKTFGIVGLGNIGTAVAKIALAFGMRVIALTSKEPEHLPDGVEKTDIETLFKESDVLSLHCPLTEDTRNFVNAERIRMMKPGAIVINTGRGPLVDERAMANALSEGRLRAFCADVLSVEPPTPENPLLREPRAYITPHIAWATEEARTRLMQIAADNLRAFIEGNPINNVAI